MATAKKAAKKAAQQKEQTIIDRIQSYEDACKELNKEPLTLNDFSPKLNDAKRQYLLSVERVTTVVEAMNEGHVFNYDDAGEDKRYPWWDMETYGNAEPGSGVSLDGVYCDRTNTHVGARLSMRNAEHVRHVAKIMLEDYRIIMKK